MLLLFFRRRSCWAWHSFPTQLNSFQLFVAKAYFFVNFSISASSLNICWNSSQILNQIETKFLHRDETKFMKWNISSFKTANQACIRFYLLHETALILIKYIRSSDTHAATRNLIFSSLLRKKKIRTRSGIFRLQRFTEFVFSCSHPE